MTHVPEIETFVSHNRLDDIDPSGQRRGAGGPFPTDQPLKCNVTILYYRITSIKSPIVKFIKILSLPYEVEYASKAAAARSSHRVPRMTSYGYRQVEVALARVFRVSVEFQTRAFRGRINHLQRLGLPMGVSPGKGKKIDYSREQICQWLLALEFSEFGIDPTIIVSMIQRDWKLLARYIRQATDEESNAGNEVILMMAPAVMSDPWRAGGRSLISNIPRLGMFRLNEPNISIPYVTLDPVPFWIWLATNSRLGLVNLTNRIVALDEALHDSQS